MDVLQTLGHRFDSDYLQKNIYIIIKFMQSLLYKDRRNRILYALYERRRNVLFSLIQNISLTLLQRTKIYNELLSLPRESSITRLRNRCSLTGRSRAIYRHFGISRLIFRKLA